MPVLLEERACCDGCVLHTPPSFSQDMFSGCCSARMLGTSIVVANHRELLGRLYSSKEDPWVSNDITPHSFPIPSGTLVYFWAGYLTALSEEDVDLNSFRTLIGPEGKEGWRLGGIEHLFLIGRLYPSEVIEGSSILGLRDSGKVRGKRYWPRLVFGDGLSLIPHGEKNMAPATRVLIVHEGRI